MKNTTNLIETWDSTHITTALAELKTDKTLENSIIARYEPLLQAIGGKTLKSLADLPKKWEKLNNEKKAAVIEAFPADAVFFTNILDLNAKLRVDAWRDSHYSHQIPNSLSGISNLKNVTELHVEHQQWETLPIEIGEMENLEVLNVSCNKLRELPDFILKLKKLRVLNLKQNYGLKTISDISKLTNLESIDFVYTDVKILSEGFFNLKNLKKINTAQSDLDKDTAIMRRLITTFPNAEIYTNARKAIELEDNADEDEFLNKEKIDISEYNLNYLPENLFHANVVKHLKIRCWNLKELSDNFDTLQTLETLDLDIGYDVTAIPSSIFRLKNLTTLIIKGSGINSLPDTMEGLENLEHLVLEHLNIKALPNSFRQLKNLKSLKIKYGTFDIFDAISDLTNLETIDLEDYHTPFIISEPLTQLINLRELRIRANQKITDDIFHLPKSIKKLRLRDNTRKDKETKLSLGKMLNHFDHATELDFEYIDFSDISDPILLNDSLKNLSLDHAKMTELPDSFSNLKNLSYFRMFGCSLEILNPVLYNCHNLENIRLSRAKFQSIPTGISKLQNLEHIGFENSDIQTLPDDILEMKNLQKISLEDCPLYKNKDFKTLIKKKIKGIKIVKGWYD
jgi:Leucine-rich repeat (LRR) protein